MGSQHPAEARNAEVIARDVADQRKRCDHGAMRGRKTGGVLAVIGAALLLGACGSPSGKYVKNSELGVFLKLPTSWTVYDVAKEGPGLLPLGSQVAKLDWIVGFDGDPAPARAHLDQPVPAEPVGQLQILPSVATEIEHTVASLTQAMSSATDSAGKSVAFEIVQSTEVNFSSGHWGVRVRVRVPLSDGSVRQAEKAALFDRSGSWVYLLEVACSPECFDRNEATINEIFQSLTMKAITR
jgi:hypothetical protein